MEKQARLAGDVTATRNAVTSIIQLCYEARAWKTLNDQIILLSKRRGQLKQVTSGSAFFSWMHEKGKEIWLSMGFLKNFRPAMSTLHMNICLWKHEKMRAALKHAFVAKLRYKFCIEYTRTCTAYISSLVPCQVRYPFLLEIKFSWLPAIFCLINENCTMRLICFPTLTFFCYGCQHGKEIFYEHWICF